MRRIHLLSLSGFVIASALGVGAVVANDDKAAPVAMTYIQKADQMEIKSMGEEGVNAFLEDLVGSGDPVKPITCGLFRLEKSDKPLVYTYDYPESKVILDGTMTVSDGITTAEASRGDVLFFPVGSTITFTTKSSGLGFICGQRPRDGA